MYFKRAALCPGHAITLLRPLASPLHWNIPGLTHLFEIQNEITECDGRTRISSASIGDYRATRRRIPGRNHADGRRPNHQNDDLSEDSGSDRCSEEDHRQASRCQATYQSGPVLKRPTAPTPTQEKAARRRFALVVLEPVLIFGEGIVAIGWIDPCGPQRNGPSTSGGLEAGAGASRPMMNRDVTRGFKANTAVRSCHFFPTLSTCPSLSQRVS